MIAPVVHWVSLLGEFIRKKGQMEFVWYGWFFGASMHCFQVYMLRRMGAALIF